MVSKIFPKDVYSVVYGDVDVGKELVKQDIDMICFTGSTKVGQELYKVAAEKFIPIILECGGSAPGIVFDDVNIDSVIESIYINKFSNTGQICDGQKRLIVHESKFDELCDKLKAFISNKKIGNPLDKEVEIGPLANKSQLEKIDDQVQDAIKKGAKVICGGEKIDLELI
jgi:succinate-semialdehyde dehydrogenase/glutarate-semialdehyde dehydrogenase